MTIQMRKLYSSPNGDRWFLGRDTAADRVFIRHEANRSSGGHSTDIEIGSFLNQSGHGPEKQELLRLIATLVERPSSP